jgi:hypothetical protein
MTVTQHFNAFLNQQSEYKVLYKLMWACGSVVVKALRY